MEYIVLPASYNGIGFIMHFVQVLDEISFITFLKRRLLSVRMWAGGGGLRIILLIFPVKY
jgi:hypothetical protein